ncbi:hypothetical protein FS749_003754, partial [Ceratobasidium sp. UAMH 11750]
FAPKAGELIAAKFSGDGAWYRAKVKRSSVAKKEVELTFIDYGNQETTAFSNTRPLDPRFKSLAPQAQDARLSFVKLAGPETEYAEDAIARFRTLTEVCDTDAFGYDALSPPSAKLDSARRTESSWPILTTRTGIFCI